MKQNSFEIITPKERLHMNKIKANYDDVIIEFEIDKNRLTVKAENLPTKPIVSKTLYHGIGIESEYGDDYVKLRTVSKSEGLNERMARLYILALRAFEYGKEYKHTFNELFPDFYAPTYGNKKINI